MHFLCFSKVLPTNDTYEAAMLSRWRIKTPFFIVSKASKLAFVTIILPKNRKFKSSRMELD